MGRYQCHQCDRVFARSFNLRRHKDSAICRGAEVNMFNSDEESVMSERRSLDDGKDIFRKPDLEDVEEVDEKEEDETEVRKMRKKKMKRNMKKKKMMMMKKKIMMRMRMILMMMMMRRRNLRK